MFSPGITQSQANSPPRYTADICDALYMRLIGATQILPVERHDIRLRNGLFPYVCRYDDCFSMSSPALSHTPDRGSGRLLRCRYHKDQCYSCQLFGESV